MCDLNNVSLTFLFLNTTLLKTNNTILYCIKKKVKKDTIQTLHRLSLATENLIKIKKNLIKLNYPSELLLILYNKEHNWRLIARVAQAKINEIR